MEENIQESTGLPDFAEVKGIIRRRRWQFLVPLFARLGFGVGSELVDSLDLSFGHADSGRAAVRAGEVCCFEYRCRYSETTGQHYTADPKPDTSSSHH